MMETLGLRTGELHAALAIDTDDPAFTVEPVTAEDLEAWVTDAEEQSTAAFDGLARARTSATGDAGELIDALLDRRDPALRAVRIDPRGLEGSGKSRLLDRKSTRMKSSHSCADRMPSSAL